MDSVQEAMIRQGLGSTGAIMAGAAGGDADSTRRKPDYSSANNYGCDSQRD